jgi:hypothetical protein
MITRKEFLKHAGTAAGVAVPARRATGAGSRHGTGRAAAGRDAGPDQYPQIRYTVKDPAGDAFLGPAARAAARS